MARIFQHNTGELNSEFDNVYQSVGTGGGGSTPISTTVTANDVCRMASGTETITGGGGDVTVTVPFDWTGGRLDVYVSDTAVDWVNAYNSAKTTVFTASFDGLTSAGYSGSSHMSTLFNGAAYMGKETKASNIRGNPKSATATSFTLDDDGTTAYIKWFVTAPADIDIAITQNDDTTTTTSGAGIPTSTPVKIGDKYIDTTNLNVYIATDTAGSYSWAFCGKGASSAFDIDTVGNMFAWWDAGSGVTYDAGNLVSSWTDRVNGWSVEPSSTPYKPDYVASWENGQPAISFNNSTASDLQLEHTDSSGNFTTFTVLAIDDTYTSNKVAVYNATYVNIGVDGSPSELYVGKNTFTKLGTYSVGNVYLLIQKAVNATSTLYGAVNDSALSVVKTAHVETVDYTKFGGYYATGSLNPACHIAEHIIYNASLTDENVAIVKAYLNNKYAIY